MEILQLGICFVMSYLIGSISFGYVAGKLLKGIDIRNYGSGNVGATNVLRTLGKGPGIVVLLLDMAKGVIAVTVVPMILLKITSETLPISDELLKVLCGISAIAGHIWTVFLKFKGGKGVATTVGVFFGITWISMLIAIIIFVIVVYLTRYISLGSICIGITLVTANMLLKYPKEYLYFSIGMAALIIYTHRANIGRLVRGCENKLGRKVEVSEEKVQ